MERLLNIVLKDNIISADVEPIGENCPPFKIAYDLKNERVVKNTLPEFDIYARMAVQKLFQLFYIHDENVPKTSIVAWC